MPSVPLHAGHDAVQGLADGIILPQFLRGLIAHLKKKMECTAVIISLFNLLIQQLGEIQGEHPCAEQRKHPRQQSGHGQKEFICKSHVS